MDDNFFDEDMDVLPNQIAIDNTQSHLSQQVENLPPTGPYTFRFQDLSLIPEDFQTFLATVNINAANFQGRPYTSKDNKTVHTYTFEVETLSQASVLLSFNNTEYHGCKLNCRYLKPRDGEYKKREYKEKGPNAFQSFNRGIIGQNKQEDGVEPEKQQISRNMFGTAQAQPEAAPAFSRNMFGTSQAKEEDKPQFSRDKFGTAEARESSQEKDKPKENLFSRDLFGSAAKQGQQKPNPFSQPAKRSQPASGQKYVDLQLKK